MGGGLNERSDPHKMDEKEELVREGDYSRVRPDYLSLKKGKVSGMFNIRPDQERTENKESLNNKDTSNYRRITQEPGWKEDLWR